MKQQLRSHRSRMLTKAQSIIYRNLSSQKLRDLCLSANITRPRAYQVYMIRLDSVNTSSDSSVYRFLRMYADFLNSDLWPYYHSWKESSQLRMTNTSALVVYDAKWHAFLMNHKYDSISYESSQCPQTPAIQVHLLPGNNNFWFSC